jgi:chromosome segregation ATPase
LIAPSANGDIDSATDVQTIEKLLVAVDRLRGERDDLRRQLEFLQMESKFTIEALESRINSGATSTEAPATAEDPRVSQLQGEVQELLSRLAQVNSRSQMHLPSSAMDSSRLDLIASASLVMVGHLQSQIDHDVQFNDQALGEMLDVGRHLDNTRQQRDDLLLRVEHLQSQVAANTRSREQWQELESDLAGKTARLSDITRSLEDAETERNSLKVEVVNLQNDMALAQEELKQAEQRYSNLQNEQLSSMSTTQVNRKLKEQIEELEGRVARRTEQIGIHQHDIKRLETNLRLQEDRIAEMTTELEVAMSEKESMVEDCADAREARDRTLKKAEDLEEAMETLETQLQSLEEQREVEVTTLVKIWSSVLSQSRSSTNHLRTITCQVGAANADAVQKLQQLSTEHNCATEVLNKQASELELAHQAAMIHREEAREAVVALAVVQTRR